MCKFTKKTGNVKASERKKYILKSCVQFIACFSQNIRNFAFSMAKFFCSKELSPVFKNKE
jgi:hypothetical protein